MPKQTFPQRVSQITPYLIVLSAIITIWASSIYIVRAIKDKKTT